MLRRRLMYGSLFVVLALIVALAGMFSPSIFRSPFGPSVLMAQDLQPFDKPPAGQTFVGESKCSSCHIEQNLSLEENEACQGLRGSPREVSDRQILLEVPHDRLRGRDWFQECRSHAWPGGNLL